MSDRALPLYDEIPPEGFGGGADEPPVATQPMPKAALALEPTPAPAAPAEQPYAYPYLGNRAIPTAAPAPVQAPQPTAAPVGQPAPVTPGRGRGTLSPIPTDERRVRAENFWQTEGGVARHVAEGIADRINAESSFNLTAPGAAGEVGLYQHHLDRKAKLTSIPNWDKDDTVQHRFALSEVNGGDATATRHWNEIKNAKTREEAGMLWDRYFERSKNGPGSIGRSLSPTAVAKTVQSGNPDATLTLIRQTLPGERFSDTDRFAALEAWAVGRLLADGKPDEAEKMQDAITRVSHAGVNSHMMEAMAALKRGDLQGAARHLDISYAFAPDGASAKFSVDSTGKKLYAQTVDEKTGTPLDKAFEVTPEAIEGQLKFTKNPVTYLKTLGERQKQVAEARRADEQAAYYRDRNKTSLQVAGVAAVGAQQRQMSANDAALHRAFLNNQTRLLTAGMTGEKDPLTADQLQRGIKDAFEGHAPPANIVPDSPEHETWRGRTYDIAMNLVANARGRVSYPEAIRVASKLAESKFNVKKLSNSDNYGVFDPANPELVIGVLSPDVVARIPPAAVKQ